ncbi:DUF732 domain-containing protein [Mycobacterium sp. 1465703.0]|uniref:DUF732 domain-containing protein n=1 Tax=Mycobacterium sp. 1465703.0 TaxID=1834078 RepID=UPI0007FDB56E|nr:DUF732 domain-containing protein [Mycobacterium sp. 1465703.0]OBJ09406.1 hypothetical protein A5625_13110 [Mycobacterium sp. 1465703.0]
MNPKKMSLGKPAACAILLAAATLVFTSPASADETDDAFIAGLANGGITMPDNVDAIATARTVCARLDVNPYAPVVAFVLARDSFLSPRQAGYFVGLSVATYCPQYKDKVNPSSS